MATNNVLDEIDEAKWQLFVGAYIELYTTLSSPHNTLPQEYIQAGLAASRDIPLDWFSNKSLCKKAAADAKKLLDEGPQSRCSNFSERSVNFPSFESTTTGSTLSTAAEGDSTLTPEETTNNPGEESILRANDTRQLERLDYRENLIAQILEKRRANKQRAVALAQTTKECKQKLKEINRSSKK